MKLTGLLPIARQLIVRLGALLVPVVVLAADIPAGDRHLFTHVVYPADAFYHAGKGGRILDVTKPPFDTKGNGQTDDTAALIQAYGFVAEKIREFSIHNANASFIIFLPRGTCLVSDTILYPS